MKLLKKKSCDKLEYQLLLAKDGKSSILDMLVLLRVLGA